MTNNRKYYIGNFDSRDGTIFLDRKIGIYNSRSRRLGRIGVDSESSSYNLGINKGQDYNLLPSPTLSFLDVEFIGGNGKVLNRVNDSGFLTIPSGIVSGDLIIVMAAGDNFGSASLEGTDASNFITDTSDTHHFIAYKYADGTEIDRTLNIKTTATGSRWGAMYFVCRNAIWNDVHRVFLTDIAPNTNPTVTQTLARNRKKGILVGLFGGDTNGDGVFVPSQYTELFGVRGGDAYATGGYEIVDGFNSYERQWTGLGSRALNGYINLAVISKISNS